MLKIFSGIIIDFPTLSSFCVYCSLLFTKPLDSLLWRPWLAAFQHLPLAMVVRQRLLSMVYQDSIWIRIILIRLLNLWQISLKNVRTTPATGKKYLMLGFNGFMKGWYLNLYLAPLDYAFWGSFRSSDTVDIHGRFTLKGWWHWLGYMVFGSMFPNLRGVRPEDISRCSTFSSSVIWWVLDPFLNNY